MIHKLQRKFIAIAMVSVTLVMLVLGVSINVINYVSTNNDLNARLEMIFENEGSVPQFSVPGKPNQRRDPHYTAETPFSTRYFVLRYTDTGKLINANMKSIAAVDEESVETYLNIAVEHGEGFGYSGNYKFYVAATGDEHYMAIFWIVMMNCAHSGPLLQPPYWSFLFVLFWFLFWWCCSPNERLRQRSRA